MFVKPILSKVSLGAILGLLIFSAIARPISNWLFATIGTQGIAYGLWSATIILGLSFFFKIYKYGWQRLIAAFILAIMTYYYLANFDIVEERLHLIKMGSLAILICYDNQKSGLFWAAFWGLLIATFVGVLDETWQYFLPNRYCDLRDMIFNAIGSLWGVCCWLLITPSKNPHAR